MPTLREARIAKGLGQRRAAKILGVPVSTLTTWEHENVFPRMELWKKIAALYGLGPYWFIDNYRWHKKNKKGSQWPTFKARSPK